MDLREILTNLGILAGLVALGALVERVRRQARAWGIRRRARSRGGRLRFPLVSPSRLGWYAFALVGSAFALLSVHAVGEPWREVGHAVVHRKAVDGRLERWVRIGSRDGSTKIDHTHLHVDQPRFESEIRKRVEIYLP